MRNPIIHIVGNHPDGPLGHVDLNDARVVFGPPADILQSGEYPDADSRGIVFGNHCDHPAPTDDEFVAIVTALQERWPDRPIYVWHKRSLLVLPARRMH